MLKFDEFYINIKCADLQASLHAAHRGINFYRGILFKTKMKIFVKLNANFMLIHAVAHGHAGDT